MKQSLSQFISKIMIIILVSLGFLQPVLADNNNAKKKNSSKKPTAVIAKKGKAADRYALLNE
ncbi:MAG: hypothetical protein V4525_01145 [Pseudomonadota bacterium]